MDVLALSSWIDPQRLSEQSLNQMSVGFESPPTRMIVIDNFLTKSAANRLSVFFAQEAMFEEEYKLVHGERVSRAQWSNTLARRRDYGLGVFVGVRPEYRLSQNLATYLRFREALRSRESLFFFEAISSHAVNGIQFSARAMWEGHTIYPHIDDSGTRRLAFSLYLTPNWPANCGGTLKFIHDDGSETAVEAKYNRLVIFDATTQSRHYVTQVQPACRGLKRLSIGGWLHRFDAHQEFPES